MADKTVSLELKVNATGATQSVSDLKKSIIDLKNQALKVGEDTALGRQFIADAGKAKDKLSDLNNQVDAFQDAGAKFGAVTKLVGSLAGGFQAATGAAALFGASGEDLQQVLVKVQAATAAAQGIQALAGITDEIGAVKKIALATASGVAGAAAKLFGISTAQAMAVASAGLTVVIGAVIALISYFASASGASDELAKAEEARKEKAARRAENLSVFDKTELANAEFKIELLKKQGAATKDILKAENDLLDLKLKLNKAAMDATDTSFEGDKKFNELSVERTKLQNQKILLNTKEYESVVALTENGAVGSIGYYNFLLGESNSRLEKLVPGSASYNKELEKNIQLQKDLSAATQIANDLIKKPEELKGKELGGAQATAEGEAPIDLRIKLAADNATAISDIDKKQTAESDAQVAARKAIRQKELDDQKAKREAYIQIAGSIVSGLASLGNLAIKNADKQAKFQKKVAVAQLLVDTATGISNMIAAGTKVGVTPIEKAVAIAGGIALVLGNMAKAKSILSKAGDVSVPSLDAGAVGAGGGAVPNAPELNQPTTNIPQGQGTTIPETKVYVTETDIKRVGNRVNVIESRATFR